MLESDNIIVAKALADNEVELINDIHSLQKNVDVSPITHQNPPLPILVLILSCSLQDLEAPLTYLDDLPKPDLRQDNSRYSMGKNISAKTTLY
ncbi:hypothetical protein LguiB_034766 [Lonicera macranthoides]